MVPATASATAALLRLNPSHRPHLGPTLKRGTSGAADFSDLTGGEYKL